MYKFLFLFASFLALTSNAIAQENENVSELKFVNPIFYQPLRPLSSDIGYAYLTPTSVNFRTPLDKNLVDGTGQCSLIENEQDHITLLCDITWRHIKTKEYYTYVIADIIFSGCLRILEYTYEKPESFPKDEMYASKYCVTPPDNKLP